MRAPDTTSRAPIEVYSFGPAWGIPVPTCSPFGLKLLTWLRMYEIPHVSRVENNPGKGPKQKCPWVVLDGERVGDSELIIERLKRTADRDLDAKLTPTDRALALTVRRMLEEHYHQAWEHGLFILDSAWTRSKDFFDSLPPGIRVIVRNVVRRNLRSQLYQRGLGRHRDEEVARMGIADLDAIEALLDDKLFFFGDEPSDIDATLFGFLALTAYVPSPSPLFGHLRSQARLTRYCDRMLARYFPRPASVAGSRAPASKLEMQSP